MRRLVALAALATVMACGSSPQGPGSDAQSNPMTNSPTRPTPGSSSPSPGLRGGVPGTSATVKPRATATSSSPGVAAVRGELTAPCLRPGERQILTVTGLKPKETTGFSTVYSDGSNEITNKTYMQGFGGGPADNAGTFRMAWRVPTEAPDGQATVSVIWSRSTQPMRLSYVIAEGGC